VGNPGGFGRKYRECCIDDSYAESFRASYALGPTAYNLASTDDLAEQSNCEGSKGSCTAGHFFRFPNTNWNVLIDVVAQSGSFKPNATSLHNDSVIETEQHYWVHVAIDRFTGQVIE